MHRRNFLLQAAAAATLAAAAVPAAQAQAWPSRPIRLIVGFAPGGGTDIVARALAPRISELLGQQVTVENRPGASGVIGADLVAKAPADGYTLVMGQTSNLAINPFLHAKMPYDPVKDLAPIALVASAPLVLVAAPDAELSTLPA